jgi:hypothetical protein
VLKQQILNAIDQAKSAIQDLAIDAFHIEQGEVTYTPGTTPDYPTESSTAIKIVLTNYEDKEIDNNRIMSTDVQGVVFFEGTDITNEPKVNSVIRVTSLNIDYRVIDSKKTLVGNRIAISTLQLRSTIPV